MKRPKQKALASHSANPDVLVANAGTVFTFCPLTDRANSWIDDNVESEAWQWFGHALVVEHRYALGLAAGMQEAGLVLL